MEKSITQYALNTYCEMSPNFKADQDAFLLCLLEAQSHACWFLTVKEKEFPADSGLLSLKYISLPEAYRFLREEFIDKTMLNLKERRSKLSALDSGKAIILTVLLITL